MYLQDKHHQHCCKNTTIQKKLHLNNLRALVIFTFVNSLVFVANSGNTSLREIYNA